MKNYEYEKNINVTEYEEKKYGVRRCNCCLASIKEEIEEYKCLGIGHTDKLFVVTVGGGNGGFEIIMCTNCLKELKEKIEKVSK